MTAKMKYAGLAIIVVALEVFGAMVSYTFNEIAGDPYPGYISLEIGMGVVTGLLVFVAAINFGIDLWNEERERKGAVGLRTPLEGHPVSTGERAVEYGAGSSRPVISEEVKERIYADWQTVRFDPSYEEPLDTEIIPICDALNAAGFVTSSSCCGHGDRPPRVWFDESDHSDDERVEMLARFVLRREKGDFMPFSSRFQKEIMLDGCRWCLAIYLNNVYQTTSRTDYLKAAVSALEQVTGAINAWAAGEIA